MKNKLKLLMVAILLFIGCAQAQAGGFSVTDHVNTTPQAMSAQTSILQGLSDHTVFLAAGECSGAKKDLVVSGMTILSFGQLCGYGAGAVSGGSAAFAPIITTGGTILDVPYSHWDVGAQIATTSTAVDAPKTQGIAGIGVLIPF